MYSFYATSQSCTPLCCLSNKNLNKHIDMSDCKVRNLSKGSVVLGKKWHVL